MKGRKPIPNHLKLLKGSFKKHRHAGRDPECPDGDDPDLAPPEHFSERQREIWAQHVRDAPARVLHAIDRSLLAIFVQAVDTHETAARQQRILDAATNLPLLTRRADGSPGESPYVQIQRRAALIVLKAGAELGFTPTSRARLPAADGAVSDEPSPWDRFRVIRNTLDERRRAYRDGLGGGELDEEDGDEEDDELGEAEEAAGGEVPEPGPGAA